MINGIEIIIRDGLFNKFNAVISVKDMVCILNNKKIKIDNKFIKNIIDIVSLWNIEYGYDNKIDSEEFIINIYYDNKVSKYHGKGIYPDNYHVIKELLEGLNNGR